MITIPKAYASVISKECHTGSAQPVVKHSNVAFVEVQNDRYSCRPADIENIYDSADDDQ